MFSITPPEPSHSYQRIYLHHNLSAVHHYSLILSRGSNLARAGKFFRASRTFRATPLGFLEPPELPSQAPGNPKHDPLWSSPVYLRLRRTLPASATRSPGLYSSTMDPSDKTHSLSLRTIQLFNARLSSYRTLYTTMRQIRTIIP